MTAKPLTAKREAFCQAIVGGMSQADAYRTAFDAGKMKDATIHKRASELMANGEVRGRLADLRKPALETLGITLQQHLSDLGRIRDLALKDGKWGPAVMAEMGRGKASGLHITKIEDVTDPLKKALSNLPADKAQEMLEALDRLEAIRQKAKSAA
jgi:phage terminase small subunit